jgi:lysophospholipase L1-like esterase
MGALMRSATYWRLARLAGILLTLLLTATSTAWAGTQPKPKFNPPKQYYLSLGDSLGFGLQGPKLSALLDAGTYTPDAFNTGYTDDFAARMRQLRPGQQVVNLSCPGETTATMISGGCFYTEELGLALHVTYPGSQLDAAVAFLRAHRGKVSPITLSIGAVDLLFSDCNFDPDCVASSGLLQQLGQNLQHILTALRAAAPDAEIIVLVPFNALESIVPGSDRAWLAMNALITRIAAGHRARAADTFAAINGTGRVCDLTFICTDDDIHPTDAGYAVMADVFFAASGYARLSQQHR